MPILADYQEFTGLHWETGSVRNYFAYRGVLAPHTGEPLSEALLMGISGGAVMGYFPFSYEGFDPMVRILTRNTFDPLDRLLSRLGVVQEMRHTASADKAQRLLREALENGEPAIVWADSFTLPYNALQGGDQMWSMFPLVVFGIGDADGVVHVADRAHVPMSVAGETFAAARGRVKKTKHRLLTLDPPDWDKLKSAVHAGIWDTIRLYAEKPPKGARHNFGFAAYDRWAKLLTQPKTRASWAKSYAAGRPLYAVMTGIYHDVNLFGLNGFAGRDTYAQFLDEACLVLAAPGLQDAADKFRQSAQAWDALSLAILPESVDLFRETRELMWQQHQLFLNEGDASLARRVQINVRLDELKLAMEHGFPLDAAGIERFFGELAAAVNRISQIEQQAVDTMRAAIV